MAVAVRQVHNKVWIFSNLSCGGMRPAFNTINSALQRLTTVQPNVSWVDQWLCIGLKMMINNVNL